MSVQIRYMGAKHGLAPLVADTIVNLPKGPCLDLFAGMCSVAGALSSTTRQTWCNDIQKYAAVISRALVTSKDRKINSGNGIVRLLSYFQANMSALKRRFSNELKDEALALQQDNHRKYKRICDNWLHASNDPVIGNQVSRLKSFPDSFPYRLVTLTYSHGYFGLRQSLELDSLRYAIDQAHRDKRLTSGDARWCLVALLQTASRVVTAPGHFAQYLRVNNQATYNYIRGFRKRSIWAVFLKELDSITPYGTREWRSGNRTFCDEAILLTDKLLNANEHPRIVYADPPYSEAQYSRYYHVLESLANYDYPTVKGIGRYRCDRFLTPFSKPKMVRGAFVNLIKKTAALRAELVISYPSNGLLHHEELITVLLDHYSSVELTNINHHHSTLGGRPGRMRSNVREMIFLARRPF